MKLRYIAFLALVTGLVFYGCGRNRPTVSQDELSRQEPGATPTGSKIALSKRAVSSTQATRRTTVSVTVTWEEGGVEGLEVAFSRSISGRAPDYRWQGRTNADGGTRIEISADSAEQFRRIGASGYYIAKATDPTSGEAVGRWGSIPIKGGRMVNLSLPIGGKAFRAASDSPLDEASPYAGSYTKMNETTGTEVTVKVENGVRAIAANGLPDHDTGRFPNPANPNTISAQDYVYTFPVHPEVAAGPTFYNIPQPFGIAINGVHIDPFAGEWYNRDPTSGWQLAALASPLGFDENNAHVQREGSYHYHGVPMALLTGKDRPELIGFAGDGFPIYGPYGYKYAWDLSSEIVELKSSYRLNSGERPGGPGGSYDGTYVEDYEYIDGAGDLDECNGRTGVTPEYPDGMYYYVATFNWPFLGRCFAGAIAQPFVREGPPPGGGPPGFVPTRGG